ncbi:uncharacterized protein LOC109705864, partial [Ananas comosus]|uniref:Uncharacterized protein LOC109705864 n=1 Tax=Ananas comosus TaxID=4615 RepID=A0A6P5EG25_ANACO
MNGASPSFLSVPHPHHHRHHHSPPYPNPTTTASRARPPSVPAYLPRFLGRPLVFSRRGTLACESQQEIERLSKFALKYLLIVNKEPNAQEKFMRIKHAYNTLTNSGSRSKFANNGADFSRNAEKNKSSVLEEEFYGLGNFLRDIQISIADFFRDLQAEFQNWEADINSQEKPKSLWEELAANGVDKVWD